VQQIAKELMKSVEDGTTSVMFRSDHNKRRVAGNTIAKELLAENKSLGKQNEDLQQRLDELEAQG
jgi:hypothetical protein